MIVKRFNAFGNFEEFHAVYAVMVGCSKDVSVRG
jgi:hypothetical protein